jgi:hypothetical protein
MEIIHIVLSLTLVITLRDVLLTRCRQPRPDIWIKFLHSKIYFSQNFLKFLITQGIY